jgi:hypothetical protein
MPVPYLACMALVAQIYALPPRVLPSIQAVEGGSAGVVRANSDGSQDFGVMQVNSTWLGALAKYTNTPEEVVRGRLTQEPCYNIAAAGAILRVYLNEAHGDVLRAVGYYHSHTSWRGSWYRLMVERQAARMFMPESPIAHMRIASRPMPIPVRITGRARYARFYRGHGMIRAAWVAPAWYRRIGNPSAGHRSAGHRSAGHRSAGHRLAGRGGWRRL